ncbi:zinc finger protein 513a isoform X1 [Alosa pseudoharengus]|uniref:zinc finger protein 513a isoform X1 n=2 Tax=Alosa pseudoharengus TaxID=34774 RepID=UPI003F8C8E3F
MTREADWKMPRRKQQNPQPVKLDSEDDIGLETAASLTFESDLILGQDLDFTNSDNDGKGIGLDRYTADLGLPVFSLADEESSSYSRLSMESDTEEPRSERDALTTSAANASASTTPSSESAFPSYLACRACGRLSEDPLGTGLDLVGPYCLHCCKAGSLGVREGPGCYRRAAGGPAASRSEAAAEGLMDREGLGLVAGDDGSLLKLHSCHLCGFSSRYANHVKRHMKTHNGEKPYRCPLCTYASAQLVNLQRHLRIHTGEKPYKCQSCAFACSSLGNLKRHQRMHSATGGATVTAGVVAPPASSSSSAVAAAAAAAAAPSPGGQQQGGGGRVTGGPRRSAVSGGHSLRRPLRSHRARREAARTSNNEMVSRNDLAHLPVGGGDGGFLQAFDGPRAEPQQHHQHQHQRPPDLHSPPPRPPPPPPPVPPQQPQPPASLPPLLFPFTCRLCGVALDDEDGSSAQICARCTLELLTKDSSGPGERAGGASERVYTCAACPFLTHYPNHLARHMKTHSGEKPYKCPQCDYASAHFDNLKRHHRVHTGEKPYKCHLCEYACGNLANLKRHQRVHSGAKPFQCALCSYSCNQSMNLKRHMLRHTGEKPHKCQECGYTTGHWDNYKRHQKKHGLAADGWVKVQLPGGEEGEEDEEEEEEMMVEEEEGEVV